MNVVLQTAGAEHVLVYSKECTLAEGWRYDDLQNPQRILLCGGSCAAAKEQAGGNVSVAFGCKTKVDIH